MADEVKSRRKETMLNRKKYCINPELEYRHWRKEDEDALTAFVKETLEK